jgi:4-amino-4-deoxy-L-arabinose transferase-like glycosyltransferase
MTADANALDALRASRRLVFPVAAVVILVGAAALLMWDVFHYDWLRGYDAYANSLYSDVIRLHHRLPMTSETDVWHTPPLFFAVAALIDSHRGVQLMDAFTALAVVVFAGLIARELFPRSRLIQLVALAFAALTPVLIRTAVMYHPEPLATALAMSGLYVVIRALVRGRPGPWAGVAAGILFGLATLTRTWALAFAGASCLALLLAAWLERTRSAAVASALLLGILLALSLPWFVHQSRDHGSPVAFNRPAPNESFFSRRPASFYTALDLKAVFSHPYAPNYLNHLLPVVYTDWWGDYWRYFEIPYENISTPTELPPRYQNPRARQSYVGLAPSLLALAGLVGIAVAGIRRRSPALLLVPLSVALLGLEFLVFQISYPHADGDTIKATYLLDAVAPLAVCGAYALHLIRGMGRLVTVAVILTLSYAAILDLKFLVLPR